MVYRFSSDRVKSNFDQLFGDPVAAFFPGTASSKLLFSDMDDPIEEGAIGKDYGFCGIPAPVRFVRQRRGRLSGSAR